MIEKQKQKLPEPKLTPKPVASMPTVSEDVPQQKRCPLCWGQMRGVGKEFARMKSKSRKYVRCDKCGHSWSYDSTWTEDVKNVNYRIPSQIQER